MVWKDESRKPKIGNEVLVLCQSGNYMYPDIDTYKGDGRWKKCSPDYWTAIPSESNKCWRTDNPGEANLENNGLIMILTRMKSGRYMIWTFEGWFDETDEDWTCYSGQVDKWMNLTGFIRKAEI